jgi:hypothetical protein
VSSNATLWEIFTKKWSKVNNSETVHQKILNPKTTFELCLWKKGQRPQATIESWIDRRPFLIDTSHIYGTFS